MKDFYKIISFYKFTQINNKVIDKFKESLLKYEENELSGLVILANEGINGTVCGNEKVIDLFHKEIKSFFKNEDLNEKISYSKSKIFKRLKIKIKDEIVTMGINDVNPNSNSGMYVDGEQWNSLIEDKNTLVIDTRNFYEVLLGSFENSINPKTRNFREFPQWIDKNLPNYIQNREDVNIAMFCTGGIRCEKATSLLKKKGYKNVFHLKGGILKYLENIPSKKNLYKGECYVFDERVAVTKNLKKGSYSICHACGMPLSVDDKKNHFYIEGIQCHLCKDKFSDKDRLRFAERQKQIEGNLNKNNSSSDK